jgi:hypothetical protein
MKTERGLALQDILRDVHTFIHKYAPRFKAI